MLMIHQRLGLISRSLKPKNATWSHLRERVKSHATTATTTSPANGQIQPNITSIVRSRFDSCHRKSEGPRERNPRSRIVALVADSPPHRHHCEERDKLRDAYQQAVSIWLQVGGSDPKSMHLPKAVAAKKDLDHIAGQLVEHCNQHGC